MSRLILGSAFLTDSITASFIFISPLMKLDEFDERKSEYGETHLIAEAGYGFPSWCYLLLFLGIGFIGWHGGHGERGGLWCFGGYHFGGFVRGVPAFNKRGSGNGRIIIEVLGST